MQYNNNTLALLFQHTQFVCYSQNTPNCLGDRAAVLLSNDIDTKSFHLSYRTDRERMDQMIGLGNSQVLPLSQ